MSEKKKPEIRFPEFTDDWEQRKLGDITSKIGSGKTPLGGKEAYVENGICLIRSQNVYDDRVDLTDVVYIDEETDNSMSNSRVVTGDVLLNITGASIGRSAVYTGLDGANVNQHVCIIRPVDGYEPKYIQLNISSSNGQKQIDSSQAGGGREGLNFQQIGKMTFMFPKLKEQQKIGVFFSNLDNLITLHQYKCDKLGEYKRGCLQKMFPRGGASVPEVRFSGFNDSWERRKLGELGTIQTCKRIFKEQTSDNGEIPFFKNGTIGLKADAFISRELFEEFRNNYPYPEKGDILISAVGSVGRTAEYTGEDEYFQDSNVVWLKTDGSVEKKYLKVFYQVIDWLIEGSTVKHLYNDNILRSIIVMPKDKTEQRKIGIFFEEIDNLIAFHQSKCEKYKELKKGLLQKMFI